MATLFSLYTLFLFSSHVAPSLTDYCDWTYEGVLLRNRLLGIPDLAHTLRQYPVPNSATTLGIGLLSLVFSWQLAAKLWLFLMLLFAFLVTRFMMMLQPNQEKLLWLIVPAGIFLNVNLWYGFMNF